jgi:enterochelin esterase-like enzyme
MSVGRPPPSHARTDAWRVTVAGERVAQVAARIADGEDPSSVPRELWTSVSATPLWEEDPDVPGAWRATFLWRGDPDVTRDVALCGPVVFSEPTGRLLDNIPGTDIWHVTLRLPPRTRSTYAIAVNGPRAKPTTIDDVARAQAMQIRDPLNPDTFIIPANSWTPAITPWVLSVIAAPDAPAERWSIERPGTARGRVEEHAFSSAAGDDRRRVYTYTPADFDPTARDLRLLVAFDGWDAVHVSRLPVVLDNLIAVGAIPTTVAVLVDSGTLEMRMADLDCSERFLTLLIDEILPWAHEKLGLAAPERSRTTLTGVSLGGRAAVHAGLRRPDIFGSVIAQAAAVSEAEPDAIHSIAHRPPAPSDAVHFHFDTGLLELDDDEGPRGFLVGVRALCAVLRTAGHDVSCTEPACGHDSQVYGEAIAESLQRLLSQQRGVK